MDEETEIQLKGKPEYGMFLKYYLDPNETETYGNGTKSIIKAFNFDPVKQYQYAALKAHRLIKSDKSITRMYLESKGLSYTKMLDIATAKMIKSNNSRWWEIIAESADYKSDTKDSGSPTNIQINNFNIHGTEVKSANAKFKEWIDAQ